MRFLVYTALYLLPLSAFAQSELYNFSKLDIYNGLSHNQVNAILKDRDGFLWFGTQSGLNRYDGYAFKTFLKNNGDSTSLTDNYVTALFELPDGKMWVATRGAHCIYDSRIEKFDHNYWRYLQSLGLPTGTVSNIIKGNNGRYWFLYENFDLYLHNNKTSQGKPVALHFQPNPSEKITDVEETQDDKLWMVYQNGLLQAYDLKTEKIVFSDTTLQEFIKGNYNNLFVDRDGDIWVWSFSNGIFLFRPRDRSVRRFSETSFPSNLKSNIVSQVIQDNNGIIWIATDQGGVTLINKSKDFKTTYLVNDPIDPKSISHNSISALYKDDNGIVWLGTFKQGVNYLNINIIQFPYYHHRILDETSLQYDDVNCFEEDKSGNIWIGTNGGGLIYFDRKNNVFKQYKHNPSDLNSISTNVIVSLRIDHAGVLWIGTFLGGLNSFDGKKFTQYKHSENDTSTLTENNVWEIFEDSKQNIWVGTLSGGLNRFDRKSGTFEHYKYKEPDKSPVPMNYISSIIEDRKGDLWVGTVFGIAVLKKNNGNPTFYYQTSDENSLHSSNIRCLLEDSKGRIWVGTRDGLNLFNEKTKTFQRFTISDGLPDNIILKILEDNNQTLWLSTPKGLCNATPKKSKAGYDLSIINYDEVNNLQSREFNDNAAFKTRSGELFFGGPSGFNIINPDKIKKPVYRPNIVFTALQIFNHNIEPGEIINNRVLLQQSLSKLPEITLKYKENVFSIEFASLDFAPINRDKYAYMMEGFNSDWLYAKDNQRLVTYTNLNPGHYIFKVKVLSENGLWSREKTLKVNIEPPFWRTPMAYIAYILIILALMLLGRRVALERIQMRFEVQQQRREAERAHELEQLKTKFFTNVSHEFRTPLSLIISPLDRIISLTTNEEQKKQLNLIQRNSKRLLNLVNQLLDFRKMEVQEMKLHPAIGDIIHFAEDICYSFSDIAEKKKIQLSFSSNIESLDIYFDKDKIEKILLNLLSNAFKYTQDDGRVSVNLRYTPALNDSGDGTLSIEVKDTGIGISADQHEKIFERFFQTDVPQSMVNQGTGIGLAITKEFVRLHNGIIKVESEPNKGSCFTVVLPAKKIYEPSTRKIDKILTSKDRDLKISEDSRNPDKKKTILVIEDNEDLRFYLKDNLKDQYRVEEATNGKEGWEKIKLLNPDLVVSDIMMPLMDGVELARNIKNETLTAHIPIILLTAMGSEDKQLEALKVGANDYVTKPFNFQILASKIRNLLAQQKLLQKRFQKQIEVNPQEVTITPVDEKFLKQALECVEKNIDNADFSVEELSEEMCMNRVTLYRKILSITGKTPIEFIRLIRLKRAAQLLEQSGMTISEIAYQVGFNNPKIFTKFFKEEFKVLPSQYATDKKEKDTESSSS